MNINRYYLITVGVFIVAISMLILGFVTTGVTLILPIIYLFLEEYLMSIPQCQKTSIQLLLAGAFVCIASVISMNVLLGSLFYTMFWAIIVHLWFKYDE